jgi:hypothetical protein
MLDIESHRRTLKATVSIMPDWKVKLLKQAKNAIKLYDKKLIIALILRIEGILNHSIIEEK